MPDVEKVISKLEELLEYSRYNDSVGWNPDNDTETLEDAIALLKAQEPVRPTWQQGMPFCGKCGRRFGHGYKYCPDCGRAVKWDD